MKRLGAVGTLVALLAAAGALLAVDLGRGAAGYGETASRDACTARADYPGEGLDPALQRIALNGLYGAACELGASREELVLSFVPSVSQKEIRWDNETIQAAVRGGVIRAIDDAEERDSLPGWAATILREIVSRAPVEWLLDRAGDIAGLFS